MKYTVLALIVSALSFFTLPAQAVTVDFVSAYVVQIDQYHGPTMAVVGEVGETKTKATIQSHAIVISRLVGVSEYGRKPDKAGDLQSDVTAYSGEKPEAIPIPANHIAV